MKSIKRNDIILLCSVLLIGALLLLVLTLIFSDGVSTVVVRVDGEEYARLPLNEDTELLIKSDYGENLLIIENSRAYIKSATCPKQICVSTGELSSLEPILCKHNHVSIALE